MYKPQSLVCKACTACSCAQPFTGQPSEHIGSCLSADRQHNTAEVACCTQAMQFVEFTCKAASQMHKSECTWMRGGGPGVFIHREGVHSGRVMGALLKDTPLAAEHMLCYHAQPLLHHGLCQHCRCSLQASCILLSDIQYCYDI